MSQTPIPEAYWVIPDQFLAGEYPGHNTEKFARQKLSAFLEAGITDFIDLTQSHELLPYDALLKELAPLYELNVNYTRIPIRDYGLPTYETMREILDAIDHALNKNRKVYVHCWGGIGRTGTTVGCYLVRHGETPKNAVAQVSALFHTRPFNINHPRSPETDEQIQFILDWHESPRYCEG
jgi:protein-tyrosine phosphatase